jgi:5,5'-dehydrodivanillate O-demethylase
LGVVRDAEQNRVIVLPQEKDKFGAGEDFATEFIETGSVRYSPQKDAIRALYERATARVGAPGA